MSRHPAVRTSRIKWTQWATWVVAALTLAAVVYLVQGRNTDHHNQRRLEGTVSALSTGMAQNQAQLEKLGERPVGPPAKSVAAGKATPPPTEIAPVTPGPTKTVTVGPTSGQVRSAVNAYFADHPVHAKVDPATLAPQVTAYVRTYLQQHPPAPGKNGSNGTNGATGHPGTDGQDAPPPSDAQVAAAVMAYLPAAVADYLTANPPPSGPAGPAGAVGPSGPPCDPETNPLCQGPKGDTGDPGPGPTAEQIRSAVADYLAANPIPPCPNGYTAIDQNVVTDTGTVTARICTKNADTAPPTDTPPT